MIVEGPQAVREAVRFAAARVRDVYLTAAASERYAEILDEARAASLYVHGMTPEVAEAMSPDAQGVVAVVDEAAPSLTEALLGSPHLVAILSNARDPGNVGTAIRAADAAGASAVILAGDCVDPSNPKVVRASAGSLFHLPVVRGVTLAEAVAACREAGLRVLATDGSGALTLGGPGADAVALAAPTAWAFGNEAWGLTPEELALADATVRIPIYGQAESLNLATAVAVCLYASAAGRELET